MRRNHLFARATLALALTISSSAFVAGCENEADPKTWVKKLSEPARRTGAMVRLKKIFDETLAGANQDSNHPRVRAFLDGAIEPIALQVREIAMVHNRLGTGLPYEIPGRWPLHLAHALGRDPRRWCSACN